MFWFKVGLFTLMNIDSLMVLACPQSSLPFMLKLLSVMVWPVCCICPWMGEGCFRCSFLLSLRVLQFLLCTPHHRLDDCIGNCIWCHFSFPWDLVLGLHKYLFYGGVTLEMNLFTILTTCVFNAFHNSFGVRDDNLFYVALFPCLVVVWLLSWLLLLCVWLFLLSPVFVVWAWMLSLLFVLVELLLLVSSWLLFSTLFCTLLMAQMG